MIANNTEPIRVQTDEGWVVVLQHAPWSDEYQLWIGFVNKGTGTFSNASVTKDGYIKLTETKEGKETPPTIRINGRAWQGLAEALRGVTPQVDKREIDAELKATKYHLEDMRSLALSHHIEEDK